MGQKYNREEVLRQLEELYNPIEFLDLYGRGQNGNIDAEAIKIVSEYVKKDPDFHKELILSCFELSHPYRDI